MTRLCLDTSAYGWFRRGHEATVEIIDSARALYVPTVVLGELRAGFRHGTRAKENEQVLQTFLANAAVETVAITDDVASLYADIWLELRRAATPLPTNDIWIAAAAASVGATVLTFDDHFTALSRVGSLVLS